MTTDQREQAEKRRTLLNDARVRDQSRNGDTGTYLSHTHSDLGGRFAITEQQTITGVVSPAPPPLPSNSPWAGPDPVPDEPSLGYEIDRMPESEPSADPSILQAEATDGPANAPSGGSGSANLPGGLVSERAGPSPYQDEG